MPQKEAGITDRAAIVTADGGIAKTGSQGRTGAGGRATGDVRGVPGIVNGAETTGGAGAFKSHLVQVELAQADGTCRLQPLGDFGIFSRDAVEEDAAGASGAKARGIDVVLEGDWDSVKRPLAIALCVASFRLGESAFFGDGDKTVQAGVDLLDAGRGKASSVPRMRCDGGQARRRLPRESSIPESPLALPLPRRAKTTRRGGKSQALGCFAILPCKSCEIALLGCF